MEKFDLVKEYKQYYSARTQAELVCLPEAQYMSLNGKGDPDGEAFAEHTGALYATAFHLKFCYKAMHRDFILPKLEAQWWFDTNLAHEIPISEVPGLIPRAEWHYRLMLRLPGFVQKEYLAQSVRTITELKNVEAAKNISYLKLSGGPYIQILHKGPFATERESLDLINSMMMHEGWQQNGYHHEIYLSDFRKTNPAKLKTILREPVLKLKAPIANNQ